MVDTTSVLIGVGSTVGLIALASFLKIIFVGYSPAFQAGPPTKNVFDFSFVNWFRVLYYFLPYGLFLFGVIYDGLIRKIKFFPAGFVGLGAVLINHLLSLTFGKIYGIADPVSTDADKCGVPGMSGWGSFIAPQNITFASTVLSYIASYISASQSDSQYSGIAWSGVFGVFILQAIIFNASDCMSSKSYWFLTSGNDILKRIVPPFLGLATGMLYGGLAGYGISTLGGGLGGGIDVSQQQSLLGGGKGPAMAPTSGTAGAGTCSPTNNDDQFVCEAYKNGELITSTIVE